MKNTAALLVCLLAVGCTTNQAVEKAAGSLRTTPHDRQAVQAEAAGPFSDAISSLEQVAVRQPKEPALFNRLGMLYRQAGRFSDARHAYETALKLNPDYALAHRNLGILLDIYLQQPQQALVHYRAYAQLAGDQDTEAALWVAEIQQRLGVTPDSTQVKP